MEESVLVEVEPEVATKIIMKPPTFDGNISWTIYLKQFRAAATTSGWTSVNKATALTLALRGNTSDVLNTLPGEELGDYQ